MGDNRKIIFKTFHTYKNAYVYDRHTNAVFAVEEGGVPGAPKGRKRGVGSREEPGNPQISAAGSVSS